MNINFTARHTSVTPEIRKKCQRRLQSIEKLLGYPLETDIILSVEKYRHKAEIKIKTRGGLLTAEEEKQDMFNALVEAFDNLEKRVKKEREKSRERKRRKNKEMMSFNQTLIEEPRRKIIPNRDFSYKPKTVEEAILELESSQRDIIVFRRFESEKWNVIYIRKDGHYGLIELD